MRIDRKQFLKLTLSSGSALALGCSGTTDTVRGGGGAAGSTGTAGGGAGGSTFPTAGTGGSPTAGAAGSGGAPSAGTGGSSGGGGNGNGDGGGSTSASECQGQADCFRGTVTEIVDGDTLDMNNVRVRLALINTVGRRR